MHMKTERGARKKAADLKSTQELREEERKKGAYCKISSN